MWAECVVFYTTSDASVVPLNLVRSLHDRVPWAEKALSAGAGSAAVDFEAVTAMVSDLRSAWEVAEQLRSRYQKALVEVLLVDTRPRQQDILRR
jgi:hypothetical protein